LKTKEAPRTNNRMRVFTLSVTNERIDIRIPS
jgi:hypothetical protein